VSKDLTVHSRSEVNMARQGRAARAAVGVLNVLLGALGVWGGGQFLASFREASTLGVVVAAAGLVAGIFFALAGVAIWRGWPQARAFGLSASAVTIAVYAAGVGAGIIGLSGLLYGVAYPAVVIVWLARPRSGIGGAERIPPETARPGSDRGDLRRMETAIA
jgi:hypothetical protein